MSKNSLPRILSALLLYEQTPETRTLVDAPVGTKAGQFVDYPPREGKKLVALSDEQNGKVVVQPYNCVINADLLDLDEARAAASTEGTFEGLQKDGDPYGILFVGLPQDNAPTYPGPEPVMTAIPSSELTNDRIDDSDARTEDARINPESPPHGTPHGNNDGNDEEYLDFAS